MLLYQRIVRKIRSEFIAVKARNILKKRYMADEETAESYESEYQGNHDYSQYHTDIKTLAFYLPQFHTFPENDAWWGKGFTEWTNTKKSQPRFKGHYQPRIPHSDIGYYDLSRPEGIEQQVRLAKQHKVYGFCFYYYWFSGKKLMEKPLDILMKRPDLDIHFCICWANENFTKVWDGSDHEILMEQKYEEKDPAAFIADLKRYMSDPRYIRVDGKPVLMIYNMGSIPKLRSTIKAWRREAKEQGIGEILIWMCRTANNTATVLNVNRFVDAEVEFPPHGMWWKAITEQNMADKDAHIFDYQKLTDVLTERLDREKIRTNKKIYHTCMMGWDNSCRRKTGWTVYHRYSLNAFSKWLKAAVAATRKQNSEEERFLFINAWNEWGEGTYLEPDEKYGYANINTLSDAICQKDEL